MAEAPADDSTLTGTALLERLKNKLESQRRRLLPELFRVVEIGRDGNGRLVKQGKVWHSDLEHVRRFGHAVAANSVSQRVVIADSTGAALEQIAVLPLSPSTAGWSGWQDRPLPPAPPRKKAAAAALPRLPTTAPAQPPDAPQPAPDIPVLEAVFDAEATATLTPAPPR